MRRGHARAIVIVWLAQWSSWPPDFLAESEWIRACIVDSRNAEQMTELVYFAWVRERIGRSRETLEIPSDVATAGDLIAWLAMQGEEYAHAFERADSIRVAIDQSHAGHDQSIAGAREIAFFPPVTGG